MQTWLTGFVGTTAFKYLVAMVATQIANYFGFDPIEGKATIEGLLIQMVGVAMGVWGMYESTKKKVVTEDGKVEIKALPKTLQTELKNAVERIVHSR